MTVAGLALLICGWVLGAAFSHTGGRRADVGFMVRAWQDDGATGSGIPSGDGL